MNHHCHTESIGGIPFEKSSVFAISNNILPLKLFSFASFKALMEAFPAVQLKRISPNEAASSNVPQDAFGPFDFTHLLPSRYLQFSIPFLQCVQLYSFEPIV